MKCEKCGKEHDGSFGSGRFCSRKCSNSRVFTEESNQKKSQSNKEHFQEFGCWGGMLCPNTTEGLRKQKETWNKKLLEGDISTYGKDPIRKRIIIEQNSCCKKCGLSKWLDQKIILEINHINGKNQDDRRENLEALCPNCHSQTETWRGRNKSIIHVSDEELIETYKNSKSIRDCLIKVGMAAKGKNYERVKNLIINEHSKSNKKDIEIKGMV